MAGKRKHSDGSGEDRVGEQASASRGADDTIACPYVVTIHMCQKELQKHIPITFFADTTVGDVGDRHHHRDQVQIAQAMPDRCI